MKKIIDILNRLLEKNIIEKYAIGGSVAVIFFTEPFETKDLDIFIPVTVSRGLVDMSPIFEELADMKINTEGQFFVVGGIFLEFVPVYNALTSEALDNRILKENIYIIKPEYSFAIALETGRPKDYIKIEMLLSYSESLDWQLLEDILRKFNLWEKWSKYEERRSI
jgi:hypothetical protein